MTLRQSASGDKHSSPRRANERFQVNGAAERIDDEWQISTVVQVVAEGVHAVLSGELLVMLGAEELAMAVDPALAERVALVGIGVGGVGQGGEAGGCSFRPPSSSCLRSSPPPADDSSS